MFDRFTERARRIIFFARYEASIFGSNWIETEHLLLALLREDKVLKAQLRLGAQEEIRMAIEALPHPIERIPTSVDLPLSDDSKRALAYGAEEAERLRHKIIDCGHLVLGLLRIEKCKAAVILNEYGIELSSYRDVVNASQAASPPSERPIERLVQRAVERAVERAIERPSAWHESEPEQSAASSLQSVVGALQELIDGTVQHISAYWDAYGEARLKRKPWSRKEALGHLIDWGSAHQQWIARALTEPKVVAPAYPVDEWVSAQRYRSAAWRDLVDLWVSLNRLLLHVLAGIPEEKLNTPCRIGVEEPIPLLRLITLYVEHCEDIVGQIVAHL